jgi:hypothetical protein
MRRLKLSKGQVIRESEILGNVSVAWFTAGIISPIFVHSQNAFDFFIPVSLSLAMTVAFAGFSIYLMKGKI